MNEMEITRQIHLGIFNALDEQRRVTMRGRRRNLLLDGPFTSARGYILKNRIVNYFDSLIRLLGNNWTPLDIEVSSMPERFEISYYMYGNRVELIDWVKRCTGYQEPGVDNGRS